MKMLLHFLSTMVLLLTFGTGLNAQHITVTVAGTGFDGNTGDGGAARRAKLSHPYAVCIDAAHNLYFSDQDNLNIRRVDARNGVVTTIAGGGTSTADGIPATDAVLKVGNICCDPAGNLYIIDANRVRRIDAATYTITTIAGGGTDPGDAIPATTALLTTSVGTVGSLNGICIDASGNVYVLIHNRLRRIDAITGIINTVVGGIASSSSGDGGPAIAAGLTNPKYLAIDAANNIYLGDNSGAKIRRIDAATGVIKTVIGGGSTLFGCPGLSTLIGPLSGMCCDGDGNLVFNEMSCSCRRWSPVTDTVYPIAGNFYIESFANDTTSIVAYMAYQYGICSDEANNYYIADQGNNRIRKLIPVSSTPAFAFGDGQHITPCPSTSYPLDSLLWITDRDVLQTETWTVYTAPTHGTLTGFPATALSNSTFETTKPTGLSYVPDAAYAGADSFKVKVSDGTQWDIITIYTQVPPAAALAGPDDVCTGATMAVSTTIAGGTWSVSNPNASVSTTGIVTGLMAGSDNVLYSVFNGCGIVTTTKTISINTVPDAGIISGYDKVCAGSSIIMSNPTAGGTWAATNTNAGITATGIVFGVTGGIDTILYSISNACGTGTASKIIAIETMPDAGVISGGDEVCIGAAITLTTTGSGGVWTVVNTNATVSATGVVTGTTAGTETIIYNATNETCGTATASKTITVNDCTAADLPTVSAESSINIYPNPASGTLNISYAALAAGNTGLVITDVAGRVVLHEDFYNNNTGTKAINVAGLSEGVYLLTITGDAVHFVNKVVISR
jgi:hypothetical protein